MNRAAQELPQRILLVRFGAMGDIVHSLPAAAALRRQIPDAQIDWLVEERWRPLLEPGRTHFLDQVFSINTFEIRKHPLSRSSRNRVRTLLHALRERRYEVSVDLQGAVKSALVCKLSGAPQIIGFSAPWLREKIAGFVYTNRVNSTATHIVDANMDLVSTLYRNRLPISPRSPIEFPLSDGEPDSLPKEIPTSTFAVMNPGAGWRNKQWPLRSFSTLCDSLLSHHGMCTILNCGPQEYALGEQVRSGCEMAKPIIFTGSISALIALLRKASLMVGPDTGTMHLAAALGVPTIGIYGPTDPARNGPYGPRVTSLRAANLVTTHRRRTPPDGSMDAISPAMVLDEVAALLSRQPGLQFIR
ncbi:MAG TPA: lipopolysaccharide heptosyltransferase I [Candidatus Saccharimonadales bacterium]|nr:lipopolysaccharide heptosyltransferase I [Candidatus Saccharimonadales bacterium]